MKLSLVTLSSEGALSQATEQMTSRMQSVRAQILFNAVFMKFFSLLGRLYGQPEMLSLREARKVQIMVGRMLMMKMPTRMMISTA